MHYNMFRLTTTDMLINERQFVQANQIMMGLFEKLNKLHFTIEHAA